MAKKEELRFTGLFVGPKERVCDACMPAIWQHRATGFYFKWCSRCGGFVDTRRFVGVFRGLVCAPCREKSRSYNMGYRGK